MHESKDKYLWQCPECGCRAFVIQGPMSDPGVVQCIACDAEMGPVDEFGAMHNERVEAVLLDSLQMVNGRSWL